MSDGQPTPQPARLAVNVVEINPHAPRPFVFTETALCLHESIQRAGFLSDLYVNRADPRALCVVIGAVSPLLGPLQQLDPRKTIIFNLEQLASDSALAGAHYRQWLRNWLVADYHSANIEHLKRENGDAQEVFELPVVPGKSVLFRPELADDKCVDVLFFGTLTERRMRVVHQLEEAGLSVETVAGAYADELTPAIRRAHIVLHVHFYSTGLFPVTRFLQPVASGVPIVCETSEISSRSDWRQSGILFAPYDGLVAACTGLLRSPGEREKRAILTRQFAARLDFSTPFSLVLEAVAGRLATAHAPTPALLKQEFAPTAPADDEAMSNTEIEDLLAQEHDVLSPESHLAAPPVRIVERQLGQGRWGVWIVWLLVLFSLFTIWQSMR